MKSVFEIALHSCIALRGALILKMDKFVVSMEICSQHCVVLEAIVTYYQRSKQNEKWLTTILCTLNATHSERTIERTNVWETIEILTRCVSFKWFFVRCRCRACVRVCVNEPVNIHWIGSAMTVAKIFIRLNYILRAHRALRLAMPIRKSVREPTTVLHAMLTPLAYKKKLKKDTRPPLPLHIT